MRQWMVAAKKADFYVIAEKFHVDPVVARIIRNREVIGEKNIRIYLGGNLSDLSDPHQMKDMDRLVEILAQKIRKQVHIRIIGDYDVDGVTSSHLFLTALRRVGAKVDVVIPHRSLRRRRGFRAGRRARAPTAALWCSRSPVSLPRWAVMEWRRCAWTSLTF